MLYTKFISHIEEETLFISDIRSHIQSKVNDVNLHNISVRVRTMMNRNVSSSGSHCSKYNEIGKLISR